VAQAVRAGLIGLGRIGFKLDEHLPESQFCLTHASALSQHPEIEFVGAFDIDSHARENFSNRWKRPAFATLKELLAQNLDLIVLAGPTDVNPSYVEACLAAKPKVLLYEKPLGQNAAQAADLLNQSKAAKVVMAVNFIRRVEPGARRVKELIQQQALGSLKKLTLTYSKGLFNNASHFIDLLCDWLGQPTSVEALSENKAEPDFRLSWPQGSLIAIALDEQHYSSRDLMIYGSEGGLAYQQGGLKIERWSIEDSAVFQGYRFLRPSGEAIPSFLQRSQYFVADHLVNVIQRGESLRLGAETALETMKICERIVQSCQKRFQS
jgi:predicted dehydrogenase